MYLCVLSFVNFFGFFLAHIFSEHLFLVTTASNPLLLVRVIFSSETSPRPTWSERTPGALKATKKLFANAHRNKDLSFWRHDVWWFDESIIKLLDHNDHHHIWREKVEICTIWTVKYGNGSIKMWAVLMREGCAHHKIDGILRKRNLLKNWSILNIIFRYIKRYQHNSSIFSTTVVPIPVSVSDTRIFTSTLTYSKYLDTWNHYWCWY